MEKELLFLKEALKEARRAKLYGEVPIGAVIVRNGEIISRAFNQKEFLQDPTAHAEVIAIRKACEKLNSWRLIDCELYSTVEPCIMCCGAIIQSRISRVIYSIPDEKFGGAESLYSILSDRRVNHRPEVKKIYIKEAEDLLKEFFKKLRRGAGVRLNGPDSKSGDP